MEKDNTSIGSMKFMSKSQWAQESKMLKFPVTPYQSNFVSLMNYSVDYYLPALDLFISLSITEPSKILDQTGGPRGQILLQLATNDSTLLKTLADMVLNKMPLAAPRLRNLLRGQKIIVVPQFKTIGPSKISWVKGDKLKESDLEAAFLLNHNTFGLKGDWRPVMQQRTLSSNGRVDAVMQNKKGQLLLVEFQHRELTKDHFSKIMVYRHQLAKDLGFPLDRISMLLVANTVHPTILECCAEIGIQVITICHQKMEVKIAMALTLYKKLGGVIRTYAAPKHPLVSIKKGRAHYKDEAQAIQYLK